MDTLRGMCLCRHRQQTKVTAETKTEESLAQKVFPGKGRGMLFRTRSQGEPDVFLI